MLIKMTNYTANYTYYGYTFNHLFFHFVQLFITTYIQSGNWSHKSLSIVLILSHDRVIDKTIKG